jgi:glycosyltransferase involved in cell wall biosynthesis
MVAGWSDFKRHWFFFKTLKQVVQTSPHVRVALAGYPGERTLQDIREWALFWGIEQHLQFHEWISPQEVSLLMQRSKVNVLWSRFEGNNRALVEGMLCDTPCILRKGHNYGYHYDYINAQTGIYASESDLAEKLLYMIEHHKEFSPRNYILNNHSFERATQLLGQSIREVECSETTVPWEGVLAYKINELHGMQYFSAESEQLFAEDYAFLRTLIRHAAGSAQKNQRPFFETSGLEH